MNFEGTSMKIAILGAGAMGSLIGGLLALGKADVSLLDVDQAHIDAIEQNGLSMELADGVHTVRIPAMQVADMHDPVDLVVLLTKTFHSTAALKKAETIIGDQTQVLTIQNGLGNAERVFSVVPPQRVLIGMNLYPAAKLGPGQISSKGDGKILIWSADGEDRPAIHKTAELFDQAGIACKADPDVQTAIWEKVCFNTAINPVAALGRSTLGGMAKHARDLVFSIAEESCAIAHAAGFAVDEATVKATVEMAFAEHQAHKPSMLQDLQAGFQLEDSECSLQNLPNLQLLWLLPNT
jgi:2-dehydropantoate 2-reductase